MADDIRSTATFPTFLRAVAKTYGAAPAIILRNGTRGDDILSFADLDQRSADLARGLIAHGVGKGSRVGFIFGNNPTFAIALAAIARIGAVAIPLSTLIRSNELVRVLRQSDVCGLLLQRNLLGHDYVERVCEALPALKAVSVPDLQITEAPYLRWIVSSGDALPPAFQDQRMFLSAADMVSRELLNAIEAEVHHADQMIEIYTSGSMALPKGVKHAHGSVLFRTHFLREMLNPVQGQDYIVGLPLFWVGGLMMSLMPNLAAGATTTCTEGTSTNSRMAFGSVLAADDLARIERKPPYWALGMSETLGPYSYGDIARVDGRPVCAPLDHAADGFEVRVADEDGNPVMDGATGEVQVRGYPLTTGLHKLDRSAYLTRDGFYRTGDLGLVEGKRIHFIGRDGDMIKSAGANVSPAEVEMEMLALPGIHSAYVVGLPDKERGQRVVAAVVPRPNAQLDFAEIERQLRQRLSGYKVPRAYIAISREEVPMLHSNKIARREIAAMLATRLLQDAG